MLKFSNNLKECQILCLYLQSKMTEQEYDIVIVGSGLGGLECGVILGKEGYKVLVLEKNKQVGGNLQVFSRDKRLFDTGIHYIGGLDEGENLNRYFKYLGIMDDLNIKRLNNDGFDVLSFDWSDKEYKYGQGYDRFIAGLVSDFPDEVAGINKYCETIREACQSFPLYNLERGQVNVPDVPYLFISAKEFIETCTTNPELQQVLAGTNLLYAGEGDTTPLYVHAMVINSYIISAWRCINGGSQIAILLSRLIRENGGKVLKHAEVDKFEFEGKEIKCVATKDGRKFYGKQFISNIHPVQTLQLMEEDKVRKAYRKRITALENSTSVFILYLVLKKDTVPYFNCNYYHTRINDVWETTKPLEDWPSAYAIFTGASDDEQKFADAMTVMAYMDMDEMTPWEDSFNIVSKQSERGKDYESFKIKKAEILIDLIEDKFPGIRNNIESYYTSTPLTYRDYIGTSDGSLYGIKKDFHNPIRSFISPRTKVPNLFLTGQNLNLHGVLGVTIASIVTCGEILGHDYLMDKILAEV